MLDVGRYLEVFTQGQSLKDICKSNRTKPHVGEEKETRLFDRKNIKFAPSLASIMVMFFVGIQIV